VVSFTAVFATHKLGSIYHSFSQYHNERKARRTAGRPKAMRVAKAGRLGQARRVRCAKGGCSTWAGDGAVLADTKFGATVVESLEALAFMSIQS